MNNDLISRKALKEALEPIAKQLNDSLYGDGIYRALKEIDNAPTVDERPQGEWIPVDEGLPEALQSVLVTSKSGRVYTSYIAHGDWEYGGEVIAWQPLPKPYKKGDTE